MHRKINNHHHDHHAFIVSIGPPSLRAIGGRTTNQHSETVAVRTARFLHEVTLAAAGIDNSAIYNGNIVVVDSLSVGATGRRELNCCNTVRAIGDLNFRLGVTRYHAGLTGIRRGTFAVDDAEDKLQRQVSPSADDVGVRSLASSGEVRRSTLFSSLRCQLLPLQTSPGSSDVLRGTSSPRVHHQLRIVSSIEGDGI